jgi:hypothetical protein
VGGLPTNPANSIITIFLVYNLINNESVFAGSKNNYESVLENDIFAGLFSDSASSGKLFNATITDYAPVLKKARVSVGNVPVGIYRQGPKDKKNHYRKPQ